jgi:hypothetical protein
MVCNHLQSPQKVVPRYLPETIQCLEKPQQSEGGTCVGSGDCRRPPACPQQLHPPFQWGTILINTRATPTKVDAELVDARHVVQDKVMGCGVPIRADDSRRVSQLHTKAEDLEPPSIADEMCPVPFLYQVSDQS